jgi:hypothetical protein
MSDFAPPNDSKLPKRRLTADAVLRRWCPYCGSLMYSREVDGKERYECAFKACNSVLTWDESGFNIAVNRPGKDHYV